MKCSRIKKLLFTDFMDGEADERTRAMIAQHLKACKDCRRLEGELKEHARSPFASAEIQKPPRELWYRVRSGIEQNGNERSANRIPWFLSLGRKTLYASAAAAVAVIAAVLLILNSLETVDRNALNRYLNEQVEFLCCLREQESNGTGGSDNYYFGTTIEKYFL